jgi:hypothetical protein
VSALLVALSLPGGITLARDAASPAPAASPLVVFEGNVLFDDLIYRSVLDLPPSARATPAEALAVSAKLRRFLRHAGYELATVHAEVQDGRIVVAIDEGRLDKIVVLGQGVLETFRFKLDLAMPAGVFNRPILERQLRVLAERYRLRRYSYRLVPADVAGGEGPTIEEVQPDASSSSLRPGQLYQLFIVIASSPWSRGFSPELSIDSPEGLGVGGQYRGEDFLLLDDRWEGRVRVAGTVRQHLDSDASQLVMTRLFLQGRWLSPPVLISSLRPALTLRADLLSLQRADLNLDSFRQWTFAASLDASVSRPSATVALGIGIERRFLVSLVTAKGTSLLGGEPPPAQTRPYAEARAQLVFNPGELRTDRKHALDFEGRFYTGSPSSEEALWLRASYQHRFPFGWHELWWQARGTLLLGQVLFPDEESIGVHLHGALGGSDFARKLGSTGLEFRYSLLRDVIKLGLFYDQVLFGTLDRTADMESPRSAGAGGPAVHLLLADQFQIDAYLWVGWSTGGAGGYGFALVARQVY